MIVSTKFANCRRALFAVLLLAGLIPVGGCSGVVERRWTEDVEIDGGRVIGIERYVKFQESNSLSGDAYSSTGLKSTLKFTRELSSLPAWHIPLVPILLYQDQSAGEWVIVATTSNCDTWYERDSPVPPYWEYRLQGDKWEQTKLSEASIGRKTNLFFSYEPPLPAAHITPDIKNHTLARKDFAGDYRAIDPNAKGCIPRTN